LLLLIELYVLLTTGRQIDGVWHTAVVAYGEEFFYGGIGIQSCSPVSGACLCLKVCFNVNLEHCWCVQRTCSENNEK